MNVNEAITSIAVLDTDPEYFGRPGTNIFSQGSNRLGEIFSSNNTVEELIGGLKTLHQAGFVLNDKSIPGTYKIDKVVDLIESIVVQYEMSWNKNQLKFAINLVPKACGLRKTLERIMEIN